MNVQARIDGSTVRLVSVGLDMKTLAEQIDDPVLRLQIRDFGESILAEALTVEDIGLDIAYAKQALNLGREKTPNRTLQDRGKRIELLTELQNKAA